MSNRWQDIPGDSYLYSSAFTDCVNRRNHGRMKASAYAKTLRLVVRAPQLRGGCQLAVVGEDKAMGQWIADKAVRMVEHNHNEWVADLNLRDFANAGTTEFKFVAWTDKGELLWETGANRRLEQKRVAAIELMLGTPYIKDLILRDQLDELKNSNG